jgi:hypothetical protein
MSSTTIRKRETRIKKANDEKVDIKKKHAELK